MYAFTPDQTRCLVYEDFYLAIDYTFCGFIKIIGYLLKTALLFEGFDIKKVFLFIMPFIITGKGDKNHVKNVCNLW